MLGSACILWAEPFVKRIFLLCSLLFCLPGCRLIPSPLTPPSTALPLVSSFPYYPFLSPLTFGRTYVAQHLMEGRARGQNFVLQVYVEIAPDGILLLGFTPWQTRAFVLRYDGNTLAFENFTDRAMPFPPELILSDLQQVLWPSLPNQNDWQVTDDPHTHERRVSFQHRLITRIQYHEDSPTHGDVELFNIPWDYQLRIHRRQEEEGPPHD
jgi:hypothetical protein